MKIVGGFFVIVAMAIFTGCGGSSQNMAEVNPLATIIDVRTPTEFADGHIEGAINMDLEGGVFEAQFSNLDPSKPYIVYCRSGRRSGVAFSLLKDNGFNEVVDLETLENTASKTGLPIVAS